MKKGISCKWNKKKTGVAILHLYKIDFKIKTVTRDKERHYLMTKASIQKADIIIVNIYAFNIGVPLYIRQMLIAMIGEIHNNIIIVGGFNPPVALMGIPLRQKINKETQALYDTLYQMGLIDIYRAYDGKAA